MYQIHRKLNPLSSLRPMLEEYQSMCLSTRKHVEPLGRYLLILTYHHAIMGLLKFIYVYYKFRPVPVAARSKAWV